MIKQRQDATLEALAQHKFLPLAGQLILDVGCGNGSNLIWLKTFGAKECNLHGIDVIPQRVEDARHRCPDAHLFCADATEMAFSEEYFDLIFCFVLFSSVAVCLRPRLAARLSCALKPGGAIIWWDARFPNPRNSSVTRVSRQALRRYFPGFTIHLRSLTVLPQLARTVPRLYTALSAIPLLHSHWFGCLLKAR